MSVVPVDHLDGAREVNPVRQARQDEGFEVCGVQRVGLDRSKDPKAAFSLKSQGVMPWGNLRPS